MELIPQEEICRAPSFNFAPMIDFLFLMLSFFAMLAVSHAALFDTQITLAELQPEKGKKSLCAETEKHHIHLSVSSEGLYTWKTEFQEYPMKDVEEIQTELARQQKIGAVALDTTKTEILLHIDKRAPWESVALAIFGVREAGFAAHPVYEPL